MNKCHFKKPIVDCINKCTCLKSPINGVKSVFCSHASCTRNRLTARNNNTQLFVRQIFNNLNFPRVDFPYPQLICTVDVNPANPCKVAAVDVAQKLSIAVDHVNAVVVAVRYQDVTLTVGHDTAREEGIVLALGQDVVVDESEFSFLTDDNYRICPMVRHTYVVIYAVFGNKGRVSVEIFTSFVVLYNLSKFGLQPL